ncbi:YcaO-like family protein [Minwuia sp.]|uniref:YcaO-like family protein n=1 Tax=Minwuia sp. TaxID=2493630 RepID=UPI003A933886
MSPDQQALFNEAACALGGGEISARAASFLNWLDIAKASDLEAPQDFIRLLLFAQRLERLFELPVPDAPGIAAFGAEIACGGREASRPIVFGVSGIGVNRHDAFRSCVAEAIEIQSQFRPKNAPRGTKGIVNSDVRDMTSPHLDWRSQANGSIDFVESRERLDSVSALPATLCYRNESLSGPRPRYKIGIGCAAGRSYEDARMHAVLEWVERDSAALWWQGLRKARPISSEAVARTGIADLIGQARLENSARRSWFLDISRFPTIPVIAAVSMHKDGTDFAFGLGAGTSTAAALKAAFLELCQIELADRIVQEKLKQRSDSELNEMDRIHLARRTNVEPGWDILHPKGTPNALIEDGDPWEELVRAGVRLFEMDLAQDQIGVPVVRIWTPDLQPMPAEFQLSHVSESRQLNIHEVHNHPDLRLI